MKRPEGPKTPAEQEAQARQRDRLAWRAQVGLTVLGGLLSVCSILVAPLLAVPMLAINLLLLGLALSERK